MPAPYESASGIDTAALKPGWTSRLTGIFEEAQLPIPANTYFQTGGKTGLHSEHLGFILAEMQYMQRAYPNVVW